MRDGVVLIDKPSGMSSFKTVKTVSRILGVRKAGHAGTLDPMATGLLVVCLGRATKISRFIMEGAKQYEGMMRLGIATDTYDAEGRIIEKKTVSSTLGIQDVSEAASRFTGKLLQSPPPFSAAKHQGVPLYRFARKGEMIHKEPREIEVPVFHIEDAGMPDVRFRITCSRGTYVRSLVHDLGRKLGCGAHMTALRRLRCGDLDIATALPLDELARKAETGRAAEYVMGVSEALSHMPSVTIGARDAMRIRHGQGIDIDRFFSALKSKDGIYTFGQLPFIRLITHVDGREELVAVAKPPAGAGAGGMLRTEKVWN